MPTPTRLHAAINKHSVLRTNAFPKTGTERNAGMKMPERPAACQKFASAMEWVPLQHFDLDVKLAKKDRPILCGAIAAHADYLLTSDKKDFCHLFDRTIGGVKIVSVQLLLADLIALGSVHEFNSVL